jgi:hypothetical protein
MPVLKSLSFTALLKAGNDPIQTRRAKFVAKLEEQKLLLQDLYDGWRLSRTVHREP